MPPNGMLYSSGVYVDVELERVPDTINNGHIESDFETAINYSRSGKFQFVLLAVSGTIYAACAISSTTLSFVLPSAECDFHLTSTDKGKLSAMPLIGMLFGCCFWGSLADSQGRKVSIMLSLLTDFFAALISSFAQSFHIFLICRFFSGFGIIGATILIFSYLGEFLSTKHRDKFLGKLEMFWNIGVITLPGLAWCLLGKNMVEVFQDGGSFSPWRIFALVCSLPSLISAILLYFMPETPKYLMAKKRYQKAMLVFQQIYAFNTGENVEKYPVHSLEGEDNKNEITEEKIEKYAIIQNISETYRLVKSLASQQYLKYLLITCFADFGLMASYYTLVLWFPEIFDRFNQYEFTHPNRTAGVCTVSQKQPSLDPNVYENQECIPTIDDKVFLETLIIGVSCIPTSVSLSYFMYKFGKKFVLVFSLILSGLSTLSLNWVSNTTQTLVFSCIFEALTSILESVLFCVIVGLFPTNLGFHNEWKNIDPKKTFIKAGGMGILELSQPRADYKELLNPVFTFTEHAPATFEEAITATKFGKFNITLALLTMLATLCSIFDSTTMSYAFVAAQCDLDLSLSDKGLLSSVTYVGMLCSAMIWGFLFDVLGRRRLLTIGFLVDAVFVFTSAFSQNMILLVICKFCQGFIINGPFAALCCYMSEFHCAKYRPSFQLLIGCCNSFALLTLPLIAWVVLSQNMDFTLGTLNFHSWNVLLFITGLPAFLSGLIFLLFPESPKFLMTCGENEKALAVFRKVYSINTGLPEDTFPIKQLVDETKIAAHSKYGGKITAQRTKIQALKEGFQQIRPLFFPPHLPKISLTCSMMFFMLMSLNMLRLWLPQIFQLMTDYQVAHNGSSASLCTMIEIKTPKKAVEVCTVNTDNSTVYINSVIVGFSSLCACVFVGIIIRFVAKKKILLTAQMLGSLCCIVMYFSKHPAVALACSALFIAVGNICVNVTSSITVDLFPTSLRTLALSMGLMLGRLGAMTGIYIFPFLLQSGCGAPFFVLAGLLLIAFVVGVFLPNTDMKALA